MTKKKGRKVYDGEISVYKDGEMISIGTFEECAEELNYKVTYLKWLSSPTGRKRVENCKDPENALSVTKLDIDIYD